MAYSKVSRTGADRCGPVENRRLVRLQEGGPLRGPIGVPPKGGPKAVRWSVRVDLARWSESHRGLPKRLQKICGGAR